MNARCDLTDLPVTDCAHCRKLPDPLAEPEQFELGPWFAARYGGTCSGCAETFDAGDQVRADGTGHGYLAACCGTT
jgi:hypothetical protein